MKLERRERVFLALGGAVVLAALLGLRASLVFVDAFRAELAPAAPEAGRLRLSPHLSRLAILLPPLVLMTVWWSGAGPVLAVLVTAAALAVELAALATASGPTSQALIHLPLVFPIGALVHLGLRGARVERARAGRLSGAFTLALLAHSTIIFFPDHQAPDLGPHLGQIRRLNDALWLVPLLGVLVVVREDGRGKPHFGADYEAPYPPWTYVLVHFLLMKEQQPQAKRHEIDAYLSRFELD